jgi:hypothetical protein
MFPAPAPLSRERRARESAKFVRLAEEVGCSMIPLDTLDLVNWSSNGRRHSTAFANGDLACFLNWTSSCRKARLGGERPLVN